MVRVKKKFRVDGLYLDGTAYPYACINRLHGCGYVARDGTIKPTYPIFATRDFMKRMNVIFAQEPGGIVVVHNSSGIPIPTIAFATSTYPGEHLGAFTRGRHILEYLPLDVFRTEFMGRNWGVPVHLICPAPNITNEEMMSVSLLHDSSVWPTLPPFSPGSLEEISAIWRIFDMFGADDAEWFPYWRNQEYLDTSHPDHIKVSFFRRKDKGLLMVVSNLGNEDLDRAWVRLNVSKLRLPRLTKGTMWKYSLPGEPVVIGRGRIELSLPKWTPRMIMVQ